MNVIVVGDASSNNLGDPILTASTKYIIEKINKDHNVHIFDIAGRKQQRKQANEEVQEVDVATSLNTRSKKQSLRSMRIINMKVLSKWI